MWKLIDRYNRWFDDLQEPWRMIWFLVKIGIPSLMLSAGVSPDAVEWYAWSGIVCFAVIATIVWGRMTRPY